MTVVDFTRYSSNPDVAPATFDTLDDARDFLSSLKFMPFGGHETTFDIDDESDPPRLVGSMMALDSDVYDFQSEYGPNLDDPALWASQTAATAITEDDWRDRRRLLDRLRDLVAYFMAHEGLEWLRFEDGTHIHNPHTDGDVAVMF